MSILSYDFEHHPKRICEPWGNCGLRAHRVLKTKVRRTSECMPSGGFHRDAFFHPCLPRQLTGCVRIYSTAFPFLNFHSSHTSLHASLVCVTSTHPTTFGILFTALSPSRPPSPSICRLSATTTALPMRWKLHLPSAYQNSLMRNLVALELGEFFFFLLTEEK
jgi:hypothetical protein